LKLYKFKKSEMPDNNRAFLFIYQIFIIRYYQ